MIQQGLWAGTHESLDYVMHVADKVMEMRAARGSDPFELPPLYQVKDGVGVLSISGPMINGEAGFFRLFGVIGYDDIRAAAGELAAKKDVKAVLMDVATPGGHVHGLEDAASALRALRSLKPLVTYTGSQMASAGYWLGSAGKRILASKTAEVGSIGAVIVHMERSRMLEKEGFTATVVRSGPYKHLGNSVEPLSDAAKAVLQANVDQANDMFEATVALNLGISQKVVHEKMGGGRVFMGVKAQEVGLVHGIASFEEAFSVAKLLGSR